MTLADFRKNKDLMLKAKKLQTDPTFRKMLEVWDNEHVRFARVSSEGVASDDKSLRLGQIEGYDMAQQKFRMMFEDVPESPKPLRATFPDQKV